jgi:hypothetical protein
MYCECKEKKRKKYNKNKCVFVLVYIYIFIFFYDKIVKIKKEFNILIYSRLMRFINLYVSCISNI